MLKKQREKTRQFVDDHKDDALLFVAGAGVVVASFFFGAVKAFQASEITNIEFFSNEDEDEVVVLTKRSGSQSVHPVIKDSEKEQE